MGAFAFAGAGGGQNLVQSNWIRDKGYGVGASLFTASLGIVDYTSRMAADVLKTSYLRDASVSENRLYFGLVWGLVVLGCAILLLGVARRWCPVSRERTSRGGSVVPCD